MYYKQLYLPFTLISNLQNSSLWNISKIAWGHNNKNHQILYNQSNFQSDSFTQPNHDILKVFYPKDSYSPSKNPQGGLGFYANLQNIFPANDVTLSYQLKFDDSFDPVLGGKLPGLFLSKGTNKKYMKDASGGKHSNYASSIRLCWKQNFSAEAYLYIPSEQSPEFLSIPNLIRNNIYGYSLWRGSFQFKPLVWNNITIRIKLNSFDKSNNPLSNGLLTIIINDIQQSFDKLIWRSDKSISITAILFSTFFGGSTIEYATPNNTWTYFKNMSITKFK